LVIPLDPNTRYTGIASGRARTLSAFGKRDALWELATAYLDFDQCLPSSVNVACRPVKEYS
jgi:hypothetical protein